jgi:hypothetical protein
MRIRSGVIAAGITVGSFGFLVAAAGAASALTPTPGAVTGVITGLHTFTLNPADTVVLGEFLRPDTPFYGAYVPVTGISTVRGVTTVTTGFTFLPLGRADVTTIFTVVLPPPPPPPPPPP